jgi:hypothetical protein
LLTLVFQSGGGPASAQAIAFAKAVVWSIIWPLSWIIFLKGL